MDYKENVQIYCRIIRERSADNKKAVELLYESKVIGPLIGILRQELDSYVRVIFFTSQKDLAYQKKLVDDLVQGKKWTKNRSDKRLTDKEMVDHATYLNGWEKYAYKFGCSFIHLSNFHDYYHSDPFKRLTNEEKEDCVRYLKQYHHGDISIDSTFEDIIPYLPKVFQKISSNLSYTLDKLESRVTGSQISTTQVTGDSADEI